MNHSLYNGTGSNEGILEDVYAVRHYQCSETAVDVLYIRQGLSILENIMKTLFHIMMKKTQNMVSKVYL